MLVKYIYTCTFGPQAPLHAWDEKWKGRWRWSEKSFFQMSKKNFYVFHFVQMKKIGCIKGIRHTTVPRNEIKKDTSEHEKEKIHVIVALNFSLIIGHVSRLLSCFFLFFFHSFPFLIFLSSVSLTIQCGNKTIFLPLFCRQAVKLKARNEKTICVWCGRNNNNKRHQKMIKNWKVFFFFISSSLTGEGFLFDSTSSWRAYFFRL